MKRAFPNLIGHPSDLPRIHPGDARPFQPRPWYIRVCETTPACLAEQNRNLFSISQSVETMRYYWVRRTDRSIKYSAMLHTSVPEHSDGERFSLSRQGDQYLAIECSQHQSTPIRGGGRRRKSTIHWVFDRPRPTYCRNKSSETTPKKEISFYLSSCNWSALNSVIDVAVARLINHFV